MSEKSISEQVIRKMNIDYLWMSLAQRSIENIQLFEQSGNIPQNFFATKNTKKIIKCCKDPLGA